MDMIRLFPALLLGCTIAVACAPSHRLVHDGNVYFEHCYAAEFNEKVSPVEREACWNAWLADYTRHQPAHRIDYAMRRVEAIQAGDQTLKLPGVAGGQNSPPTDPSVAAQASYRRARVGAEVATVLSRDENAPPIPNGCSDVCRDYGQRCTVRCPPDFHECRILCGREEAICENGCY